MPDDQVTTPRVHSTSKLVLHPYEVRWEAGRRPVIGCSLTRAYVETSAEAVEMMRVLAAHPDLSDPTLQQRASDVDVVAFAQLLVDKGFVAEVDGTKIEIAKRTNRWDAFLWRIPPRSLSWITSRTLAACVGALFLAGMALLATGKVQAFDRSALTIFEAPIANLLAIFGGFLLFSYLHEIAHFLVARRYGLRPSIHVSHRYYMVVLHTDVTEAWMLPRSQRVAIFMAGIVFNLAVASTMLVLLAAIPDAGFADEWAFVAMLNVLPLVYQFLLYARTDLYHVFLALTGERNLAKDSQTLLFYRLRRRLSLMRGRGSTSCLDCTRPGHMEDPFCFHCKARRESSPIAIDPRSARTLTFWGPIQLIGSVLSVFLMFFIFLPFLLIQSAHAMALALDAVRDQDIFSALQALVLLALLGFQAWFMGRVIIRIVGGLLLLALLQPFRLVVWGLATVLPASLINRLVSDLYRFGGQPLRRRGLLNPSLAYAVRGGPKA